MSGGLGKYLRSKEAYLRRPPSHLVPARAPVQSSRLFTVDTHTHGKSPLWTFSKQILQCCDEVCDERSASRRAEATSSKVVDSEQLEEIWGERLSPSAALRWEAKLVESVSSKYSLQRGARLRELTRGYFFGDCKQHITSLEPGTVVRLSGLSHHENLPGLDGKFAMLLYAIEAGFYAVRVVIGGAGDTFVLKRENMYARKDGPIADAVWSDGAKKLASDGVEAHTVGEHELGLAILSAYARVSSNSRSAGSRRALTLSPTIVRKLA